MKNFKSNKGITLIALVITIIVLIILAMVTIAMLTGPNGLLNKATEAKIENDKGEIQDRAETEVLASIEDNGKINWDELRGNLASNFGVKITNKETNDESKGFKFTVEKNNKNYEVEIDEKGKVTVTSEGEGTGGGTSTPSEEPSEEPKNMISFNINGVSYKCEEGSTWSDWMNSSDCPLDLWCPKHSPRPGFSCEFFYYSPQIPIKPYETDPCWIMVGDPPASIAMSDYDNVVTFEPSGYVINNTVFPMRCDILIYADSWYNL